ncbi:hypothetical protein PR001_g7830 [Phytophthora rubi]|uniref:Uncharacterized protein n=1 Tax=Phytophthora rubi TaxID=129364 RepID=A0A6A3NEI2_9STRA|nr:hypothetical protein PR001_g7830 [Phytophthora rubi]
MKNCDPFVPEPALAMGSKPASVCLSQKFSYGNFASELVVPQLLLLTSNDHCSFGGLSVVAQCQVQPDNVERALGDAALLTHEVCP